MAIAYTRMHGIPMGRRHRPLAAWIGDAGPCAACAALLREGAVDVELHFGEPIEFSPGDDRKEATRRVEADVRAMLQAALADPRGGRNTEADDRLFFAAESR